MNIYEAENENKIAKNRLNKSDNPCDDSSTPIVAYLIPFTIQYMGFAKETLDQIPGSISVDQKTEKSRINKRRNLFFFNQKK